MNITSSCQSASSLQCVPLSPQEASIQEKSSSLLQAIFTDVSSQQKTVLQDRFGKISSHDLAEIIDHVCHEISTTDDPMKAIERLAEIVPFQPLQDAVRTVYPSHTDALKTAKDMLIEAKYYLERSENSHTTPLLVHIRTFLDSVVVIIDNYLKSLGIADLFTPSDDSMRADHKMFKMTMLIGLPGAFLAILSPILGPQVAAIIVAAIAASVVALSLVLPLIRPAPAQLPQAENWTKMIQEGKISPQEGRDKTVEAIAQTLISNKRLALHPLLIGRSGIGKTEVLKKFANEVLQGRYPELQGKKVFYINTADLVDAPRSWSDDGSILSRISTVMGRHREDIILVFDEIHLACQQRDDRSLGEQMKVMLDPGAEKFPYVIGITTEEEYYRDIFVNNTAFARRFKPITVENTERNETLRILNNCLLQQAPQIIPEEGIIPSLLEKTQRTFSEKAPQPATSLKILSKALRNTCETQKTHLEEKIDRVRKEISYLYSSGSVQHGAALLPYSQMERCSAIEKLESKLQRREKRLQEQHLKLSSFFHMRDLLPKVKAEAFRIAIKVAELQPNCITALDNVNLTRFLLMSHFFAPALTEKVIHDAAALGVKTTLDTELVDRVIAEEQENERQAQAEIAKGHQQIRERSN